MPILQTRIGSGGGGGGDATAANQTTQITLESSIDAQISSLSTNFINKTAPNFSGIESVWKDANLRNVFQITDSSSVFKDIVNNSVFQDQNGLSVLRDNTDTSTFNTSTYKSILKQSKISNNLTNVISFFNTSPSTLAADIETWLQSNNVVIIQICYADAGGVAPNPHTALIIYNLV
jgi:hypothetical protein